MQTCIFRDNVVLQISFINLNKFFYWDLIRDVNFQDFSSHLEMNWTLGHFFNVQDNVSVICPMVTFGTWTKGMGHCKMWRMLKSVFKMWHQKVNALFDRPVVIFWNPKNDHWTPCTFFDFQKMTSVTSKIAIWYNRYLLTKDEWMHE